MRRLFRGAKKTSSPRQASPRQDNLRFLRERYEEYSAGLDMEQTKFAEVSSDLYGAVKFGSQDEDAQLYRAAKASELEAQIAEKANKEPWLEFGKIIGLSEDEEYKPEHFDTYKELADSLLKIIGGKNRVLVDSPEYKAVKDLQYLKRAFYAFKLKHEKPQGKPYLIAQHPFEGIKAILGNTFEGRGEAMSATMIWSGEKGQNVPCYLYGDKKIADPGDLASFGVVYDPEQTIVVQGEFFASQSFGKVEGDRKSKLGARAIYTTPAGVQSVTTEKSKYSSKQVFEREITYDDGSRGRIAITDHSRWSSRDKAWDGEDDPDKRFDTFADNVWWRYNRPNIQKFREQFAPGKKGDKEYEHQRKVAQSRGAQRMEGRGLAQYNEALITPKLRHNTKYMPMAIFLNLSVSRITSQEQLKRLIPLLKQNPRLKFCIYDNKKESAIMEEFDNDVALEFLIEVFKKNSTIRVEKFQFDEGLIENLKARQYEKTQGSEEKLIDVLEGISGKDCIYLQNGDKATITKSLFTSPRSNIKYDRYEIKFIVRGRELQCVILRDTNDNSLYKSGEKKELLQDSDPLAQFIMEFSSIYKSEKASKSGEHSAAAASHPSFSGRSPGRDTRKVEFVPIFLRGQGANQASQFPPPPVPSRATKLSPKEGDGASHSQSHC